MLREQRGEGEQDEVRRQERREAEDGGYRTGREGDQDGGQDREAREDEDAARDERSPVRERESFLHGPRTRLTSDKGNAHPRRCIARSNSVTQSAKSCVARSVKFQPGLEGSYHKRMRIKIGPSACIDCRMGNSQTFLWGPPDTGPLARDFLRKRDTRGEPSRFQGERGDP